MATMADVAAAAGVSITTVSHYLNKTRAVHKDTAVAVETAIMSTGYVLNSVARSLATSSSNAIGVVVPAVANPYLSSLISSVESALLGAGYSLLLGDSAGDPLREEKAIDMLLQRRIDGLILATVSDEDRLKAKIQRLNGLPLVLLDQVFEGIADVDQVGVDNADAIAGLVKHMHQFHGHTRIAFIGGQQGLATSIERMAGFRRGLADCGLADNPEYVVSGSTDTMQAVGLVQQLMSLPLRPTAIITGTGHMAVGALRGLKRSGLSVPDDVALATFDEIEWSDLLPAPLSAINQPYPEMANKALELVLRRIRGVSDVAEIRRIPTTTIYRESCGHESKELG